ncbi:SDR family oxidoreductase [bacterium SCSIO 12741]|nr:SDR family oxidoreductase [bacterium SCSIO 12741]
MNKTVLITGSSTGIGKSAAQIFQAHGWNVIATMRKVEDGAELSQLENVLVAELDVTKQETIDRAIAAGIEKFGRIDVLVNNAGFGMMGVLEASSEELMKRIFDVNVFGVIRTTKAILPHFRAQKAGTIVNVSSIVGRACFPYQALYHSTKHALEGMTECSQYELKPLGINLKLVEPGGVATEFINSISMAVDDELVEYQAGMNKYMAGVQGMMENLSTSGSIAEVVYEAATDNTDRLRYLAGPDAEQVMGARQQMDDKAFYQMMAGQFGI